jgi:hypothetical protein
MKTIRYKLEVLVWTDPMTKAARKCGCSNVYLTRLCHMKGIPLPPRGHWNRAPAMRDPMPPLPPPPPGESEDVWIGEGQTRRLFRSGSGQAESSGVRWITSLSYSPYMDLARVGGLI